MLEVIITHRRKYDNFFPFFIMKMKIPASMLSTTTTKMRRAVQSEIMLLWSTTGLDQMTKKINFISLVFNTLNFPNCFLLLLLLLLLPKHIIRQQRRRFVQIHIRMMLRLKHQCCLRNYIK